MCVQYRLGKAGASAAATLVSTSNCFDKFWRMFGDSTTLTANGVTLGVPCMTGVTVGEAGTATGGIRVTGATLGVASTTVGVAGAAVGVTGATVGVADAAMGWTRVTGEATGGIQVTGTTVGVTGATKGGTSFVGCAILILLTAVDILPVGFRHAPHKTSLHLLYPQYYSVLA